MSFLPAYVLNFDALRLVVEHVFMPPKLRQQEPDEEVEREMNVALCDVLIQAAQYFQDIPPLHRPLWTHLIKMMVSIRRAARAPLEEAELCRVFSEMAIGDIFSMHIRAQNAAIVVRRLPPGDFMQVEVFEVSPRNTDVMTTLGKLLCSYPGPAIRVPTDLFMDERFLRELSSFLKQMDADCLDSTPTTSKGGSVVREVREAVDPRYISELLMGILGGCGQPADVVRITKRIGDEVLWDNAYKPWRRSPLWLTLRVSLQSSLRATNLYKPFMLFFHTHLLRCCRYRGFPSELLHTMSAKIARRLSKIGPLASRYVSGLVHKSLEKTEALVSKRWTAFQAKGSTNPTMKLDTLSFTADTEASLRSSINYLTTTLRPGPHGSSQMRFTPPDGTRLNTILDFAQFTNGQLANAVDKDQFVALKDFEFTVEKNLASWVAAARDDHDAPKVIATCIQQYVDDARPLYGDNAEDNSIMILTIMDLWVALDTLTIRQCPLLKQYSPEIPSDFLNPLLLHRSSTLGRALHIEEYLNQRHNEARNIESFFSNNITESSFAVKYFRASEYLQPLYDEITTGAQQKRDSKRDELVKLNELRKSLLSEASKLDHEMNSFGNHAKFWKCQKCQVEQKVRSLSIHVHEWPLPSSKVRAQQTVFELSPPPAFSAWRDITYMILCDLGLSSVPDSGDPPKAFLNSFSGLSHWATQSQKDSRLTLASTTKSFSDQSHYKNIGIPAEESSVLVNNGLSYRLFDSVRESWTIESSSSVTELCTPPIPKSSPYRHLHHFVSNTKHTPNHIIASQADCPEEITLHEFLAFSGLRSCPRLQWLNIARELTSPYLSFRLGEVHTLITQAAWQLGPLSDGDREWHTDLSISSFGNTLLCELESLLGKIEKNWLEEVTVRTIALIGSRLLASKPDPDISRRTCMLLKRARTVAYQWIKEVSQKPNSTQDEVTCEGLRLRLCMIAATCFSTFDVCSEHIPAVFATEEDFSIAMQCAVIVHDNKPPSVSDENSPYLARMLSRHRRLLHHLEPTFCPSKPGVPGKAKLLHVNAYDEALARLWQGYRPVNSSRWHALPRPNTRWISCGAEGGHEVHYDLLTGKLLIDGRPLGRLPQEIVDHPTYTSVLGAKIFDVGPADIPGMDYMMSKYTVSGYQVLFSWNNGDLILKARAKSPGNSKILQLIPRPTLVGDFPRHFIDEYVHWLDLKTGELEFRPAGSPWTSSPSNWRVHIHIPEPGTNAHPRPVLQKPSQDSSSIELIDIRSKTFDMVSSLLSPLESPENIFITHASHSLEVTLSRLHLSFFVNSSRRELECRSIPGYIVDKTQSCGTMFGLRNKLILCPRPDGFEKSLLPRRVIIPQGVISFRTDGNFTAVSITTNAKHVRWHEYTIDTDLGCLKGNASLSSKLYLCYLHALTSHCLPDPLLGHTGTEEALYILRSAACRSFQRLDDHSAKLLKSISDLTPNRVFYPSHLQSMATVKWNDLPALSQHHDFYPVVQSILDHARALEAFYDQPVVFNVLGRDQLLLNRAASRNKSYYPSDLQIPEQPSSLEDIEYRSRDVSNNEVAYRTSWSIWNDTPSFDRAVPGLWDLMSRWCSVGPASGKASLRYSRYWLEFDAEQDWFVISDLCRHAIEEGPRSMKIVLSFCLSAGAYGNAKFAATIPFFVALAVDERCRKLSPPAELSYMLSDGVAPERTRLENLAYRSSQPIESIPARFFKVEKNSTNFEARRQAEYDTTIRRQSSQVADSILRQWPDCKFVDFREGWFDEYKCRLSIEEYVGSVSRNKKLSDHVQLLENILGRYRNVSMCLTLPYVFSPQFNRDTNRSMAPSYSICKVLPSRTDVPTSLADGGPLPPEDDLNILVEELRSSSPQFLRLYGDELRKSYCEQSEQNGPQSVVPSYEHLRRYHYECSQWKNNLFSEISATLAAFENVEKAIEIAGLWPRITPRSILSQLTQNRINTLPDRWKLMITRYAVAVLKYQQSIRLLELLSMQKHEELLREREATRNDVLAKSTPDWLLVQIEANLLARPIQVAVALEMISPSSERNITLQLNMGEGKSSVIVPLVASTLANGSNLMRVVTLKPLSNQMFQILVTRLSGLLNRPIFYIPFSRSLHMDVSLVDSISRLYERCVAEGGVLVTQPEHILSQKLMHIDFLLTPNGDHEQPEERLVAHKLGKLQSWMANISRDVLDESDELLHVRYQLVYTSGQQMPVGDHPNRWVIIQQVFSSLQAHAAKLHAASPKKFEFGTKQRGFPTIRVLDSTVFQEMATLIINDASEGRLSNLQLGVLPLPIREAACRYITMRVVSRDDSEKIHSHCGGTALFKGILLLRGLLMQGEGILFYVLKERRWRVDYGLDPSRTFLAVPYRAKDVPSPRAEFGHPDVAIALTCLSYYYGGLTKDQLLLCFDLLAKLDDGKTEYDHWVELEHDIPTGLRQLNGVNTEDETQVDDSLVPLLSRNKRVVDFYLSQVVFPRAAREFPKKLPTSAWDLVEDKENFTTGFSGTNDNRYLLPTSITQEDPNFALGTNALVLQYLLRSENDHYECTEGGNGERESATAFLNRLVNQDSEIRVLLDVGAQVLELRNEELARHWLSLRPDVPAAIYFDDSDDLTVVTQDGTIEPFISSPYNRQLEKCVVYLDDTHTRGTDLKFPVRTRAAVTLGPKVTKDRLVQGTASGKTGYPNLT